MIYKELDLTLDYSKIKGNYTSHTALLKVYIPNTDDEISRYTPCRPSVLILPGGGYGFTSHREGEAIAMKFIAKGMNAFVLHYNTDKDSKYPEHLLQALSAIKYIRDNKEEYFVNPDKIFVCGFSAGGHLTATVGTLWDKEVSQNYFGDTQIVKPNGLILSYAVIFNDDKEHWHEGSFRGLLRENFDNKEMFDIVCADKQVSKSTPPSFLWTTFEDELVPCENTLQFALALRKNNIPFEMHIYEKGMHGRSTGEIYTCNQEERCKSWMDEACAWIYDTRLGEE